MTVYSIMPSATSNVEGVSEHINGHHVPMSNYHNNPGETSLIKEVWAYNLYEEFRNIRPLVHSYPYLAMDTEFPGVVSRPIGEFRNTSEYQYQLLRCNVDMLKLIQLGITFMDEHGTLPQGYCTWQFNFKFNLQEDMYASDSIELLTKSGIQFRKHETDGIDPMTFSELFITSGFVLSDDVKWLSFHSGYDFGYLLKLLSDRKLPKDEVGFFELLKVYFPHIYDIKYLMKSCKNLKGGLQEVADQLDIERIGLQHQAGSDSLLTGMTYFRMKEMFFEDNIDEAKYKGHLYGFGISFSQVKNCRISRCIDIPVLDPYRQQMQSNIAGIKTFTFSQDPVFEAYVQYKDYLSFVKAMDALRGSFLLYQEDSKAWVASIRVNFDKTKHLCDESIRKRRIERERLAEMERRREATKIIAKSAESVDASASKKGDDAKTINSKQDTGRVDLKIAMEERKYMVAKRKLEAIRLLDYLFERIKKQRESDMKHVMDSTEGHVSRRSDYKYSSHNDNPTSTTRRRSLPRVESDADRAYSRSPHSDYENPEERDHHHDVHRRNPRLQYMNDWEMPENQNRMVSNNYYHNRQPFENRGGRSRGNFRSRGGQHVMRYSRGGREFRPYHSQPFYDRQRDNSVSLTEAYDHAYEKYFMSISKRHNDLNNCTESQDNMSPEDNDARRYSRSRSRSVGYSRSESPRHYIKDRNDYWYNQAAYVPSIMKTDKNAAF